MEYKKNGNTQEIKQGHHNGIHKGINKGNTK